MSYLLLSQRILLLLMYSAHISLLPDRVSFDIFLPDEIISHMPQVVFPLPT